jgi:hypothetical protein
VVARIRRATYLRISRKPSQQQRFVANGDVNDANEDNTSTPVASIVAALIQSYVKQVGGGDGETREYGLMQRLGRVIERQVQLGNADHWIILAGRSGRGILESADSS